VQNLYCTHDLSGLECSTSSALSCTTYVTTGVLYIYPTQFRLHLQGRVSSACGWLTTLTSSYLNSGLNLDSVTCRTLAQLPSWNNLPESLRRITEFSISKKHLKSHLDLHCSLQRHFTSVYLIVIPLCNMPMFFFSNRRTTYILLRLRYKFCASGFFV
jgi:hypothetical protein